MFFNTGFFFKEKGWVFFFEKKIIIISKKKGFFFEVAVSLMRFLINKVFLSKESFL